MTTKNIQKSAAKPKRKSRSLALGTCSASVIRELRALATRMKPGVISVAHVLPRAYCVAKPAAHWAVFAVPTCDREPQVRDHPWATVQNESAKDVKLGDWCALAYISTSDGSGSMHVLPNATAHPRE